MHTEAITHKELNRLVWDSEGIYVFGDDDWKDISIEAEMIYNSGVIGLLPRYDSELSYILCQFENKAVDSSSRQTGSVSLDAYIGEYKIPIELQTINPLVVGESYLIKSVIKRTNFKIYLNNQLIINAEYSGIHNGAGGLYATEGNQCSDIEVSGDQPINWTSNASDISGAIFRIKELANKDAVLYLSNPSTTELKASQTITVETGSYVLSYEATKPVTVKVNNAVITGVLQNVDTYYHLVNATNTSLDVSFCVTNGDISINNVQLEKGNFPTSYISSINGMSTREASSLTYPSKDRIKGSIGGVSTWVKPIASNLQGTIFEYGSAANLISLSYTGTAFEFRYGTETLTKAASFEKDKWYHLGVSWSSNRLKLYINNEYQEINGSYSFHGLSDVIRVGHSESGLSIFNGMIDDLIIFSKDLEDEIMTSIFESDTPIPNTKQMSLRATLDHAVGNFNQSIIEISPAPNYGSPVIVKKEDGTLLQKVSFFDPDSGEYQTFTVEQVIYDGKSDYIEVSYNDIDAVNYKITVKDYYGSIKGDPYLVKGNRIYLTLSETEKKNLKRSYLWVSYQPENAFTVDFNINQPDSFRVGVGKHDGQPLTVTYEGNRFSNEKLAEMVELNPLMNPNHQGFMYITKDKQVISSFRIKASPNSLYANGESESLIVVEPLDSNGNFISNAKLKVTTEVSGGQIIANYDPGSIKLREKAGRYMYKYIAPRILLGEAEVKQLTDYINVIDQDTGIGTQIPITLIIENDYNQLGNHAQDLSWELMASRLLGAITDYMNESTSKLPKGLADIIDFNQDGMINLQEIIWLNENKFTQALITKHNEYLNWKSLNE